MPRTSAEIQAEINSINTSVSSNTASAGKYEAELSELQEKKERLTNKLNALYDTYTEIDEMCEALFSTFMNLPNPNQGTYQYIQYAIGELDRCRITRLKLISSVTEALQSKISGLEIEIGDAEYMARAARQNASDASMRLPDLQKELREAMEMDL